MSEPTRWVNDGPGELRKLLRHARRSRPMDAQQRIRTGAGVLRLAALPVGASVILWIQGIALGAGVGVVGIVAATRVAPAWFASTSPPPSSSPAVVGMVAPIKPAASIPSPSPEISATPEVASAVVSPSTRVAESAWPLPSASVSTIPSADNTLAREASVLEQARTALGSNPQRSLYLAQAHATEFPSGMLAMERELVIVDALYRLGRSSEAKARAEALMRRARGSLYEDRIRKMLGLQP